MTVTVTDEVTDELTRIETTRFVLGETLIRYVAMEPFEVDGIVYNCPSWYPGGILKLYDDDEYDYEGTYAKGWETTGELIVIEPGDAYDPRNKKNNNT